MSPKIHQTKDGSSTLYSERFDQYYHNPNGAASESLYVFFEQPGLTDFITKSDQLTILEIGFGTGLNMLLLINLAKRLNPDISIRYYSIEAFPVSAETAKDFDFGKHLTEPELSKILPTIFSELHPGMNVIKPIASLNIELHLFYGKFEDFKPEDLKADFIFHDPFSPEVNEELWSKETFLKLADYSKKSTVLSTYCAASKARGALCAAGWHVAKARGALGKREMTIAARSEQPLAKFKRVNERRLAERYQKGDF
ncbi:tRNA (5-methylaminomethyl-2-thiouridine)(34)-methyltransferase MnmD [Gracilimonas tropica]|uniref:tRNA (5-methylaminomethyl-2-thiouridine)(34)-methyltransferase MnmD n=1 Tax=Gracilimonas tropica TaxID=454600 RepID=UPI000375EBBB|nr:tRNA (5-methylaminomethyl-2-thiouridine)(34)-methyltransferase MnmD [Gracilimonas tropica]